MSVKDDFRFTVWVGEELYGGFPDEWGAHDVALELGGYVLDAEAGTDEPVKPSEDQVEVWKEEGLI